VSNPSIDWKMLEDRHPPSLVGALRVVFETNEPFELTPEELSADTESSARDALALLKEVASRGWLKHEVRFTCFNCNRPLTSSQTSQETCPHCEELFSDHPPGIEARDVFICEKPRTRDVRWVLTLHGMNTRGEWQEDFNWLVSKTYARMVPVAIYKYGLVRPGAFLRFRQRQMVGGLIRRIKKLIGETEESGFGSRPDVIAHSLGTWLLGNALQADTSLRLGRVILTGCILRPDFDWNALINSGQVEAVLNHYGTKDFWAKIAHFFIPDSGPSGRRRFNSGPPIVQVAADNFRHSDFFRSDNLQKEFEGLWHSFLTVPQNDLDNLNTKQTAGEPWKQTWLCFRATIPRYLLLMLGISVLFVLLCCLSLGVIDVLRWLRDAT
jgi:hypothetical protein